jgi:hypothetical protein
MHGMGDGINSPCFLFILCIPVWRRLLVTHGIMSILSIPVWRRTGHREGGPVPSVRVAGADAGRRALSETAVPCLSTS